MAKFTVNYRDETGHEFSICRRSVQALAAQLRRLGYTGPHLTVRDEPGFVRGWVAAGGQWGAS